MGQKRRNVQKFREAGNGRCPICWVPFTSQAAITVEHVPPKSLGGIKACLVCRECNNSFSKDEEFMRRDVIGTTRMNMLGSNNTRMAAADYSVKWKKWAKSELDQIRELHGNAAAEDAAATGGFISFEAGRNVWPSEDAVTPPNLDRIKSMKFQFPSEGQVMRAWIKSLYLMAGCASHGEAWGATWAPAVRDYLRGNKPWGDDIGYFDGNFDTPSESFVARCQVEQRSDVFISAWKEHLCVFGASRSDIPHGSPIPVIWTKDGPFVFGTSA